MADRTACRVSEIIAERLGIDLAEVRPETSLVDELAADSLDLLEIVGALEAELGVSIPTREVESFRTVSDVIVAVRQALAAYPRPAPSVPAFPSGVIYQARLTAPDQGDEGVFHTSGILSPYALENLGEVAQEVAAQHGPGVEVEVRIPAGQGPRLVQLLRERLGNLTRKGIKLVVRYARPGGGRKAAPPPIPRRVA